MSGTNQGLFAKARAHPSLFIVHSVLPSTVPVSSITTAAASYTISQSGPNRATLTCAMDVADLKGVATAGGFFSYAAGVACKILTDYKVSGLEVSSSEERKTRGGTRGEATS